MEAYTYLARSLRLSAGAALDLGPCQTLIVLRLEGFYQEIPLLYGVLSYALHYISTLKQALLRVHRNTAQVPPNVRSTLGSLAQ